MNINSRDMGGILTLRSSKIIPIECAMVSGHEEQPPPINKVKEERLKVAINPEHPEQTVMIGSDLMEKTINNGAKVRIVQGSGERRTHDGKGGQADANLLCKPGAKGPGNKLHRHGKVSTDINTCKQKAKKIFPSSPYHSKITEQCPSKNIYQTRKSPVGFKKVKHDN
ncbi:hypothetical protein Tco_1523719 [Tanacetum coccineum]